MGVIEREGVWIETEFYFSVSTLDARPSLAHPRRDFNSSFQVDLSTNVTRNLRISTPIVSSPMDTVTEEEMAIAMVRGGALGVLHYNCSLE